MMTLLLAATIESFGGGVGLDNTPALNAAILAGEHLLEFGRGVYEFHSPPSTIPFGMRIRGQGPSATALRRTYLEVNPYAGFLTWCGAAGEFGGGVDDLSIGTTAAGGSAIVLTGSDPTHRASVMEFSNLWITASSVKWDMGFVILGHNVNDPTNGGVRDIWVHNLYIFETLYNAIEAWAAKNFWVTGGQLGNPGNVNIRGISTQKSEHVFLNISAAGTLYVTYSNLVVIQGFHGALWRNATTDTLHVSGRLGAVYGIPAINEKILGVP